MPVFTHSASLKALGWSLFDSLWQMALLWLLFVLFSVIFRKASSHSRHGLALLLLGIGTGWSILAFITGYFSFRGNETISLLSGSYFFAGHYPGHSGMAPGEKLWQWIDTALPYCTSLYLLVLAVHIVRYNRQYISSKKLRTEGLSKIHPHLRMFIEEKRYHLGIHKKVGVWLSSLAEGPVTLGFLKPVILLPLATANHLSVPQMEAILLHELAHIRQNDYLINLAVTLAEKVFFFNPFARLLIGEIKKEREHRCDDLVMQFRYEPQAYGEALLSLARISQRGALRLALAAAGGNDRLLLQRVRRIVNQTAAGGRPRFRPLLLALIILVVSALSLSQVSHSGMNTGIHKSNDRPAHSSSAVPPPVAMQHTPSGRQARGNGNIEIAPVLENHSPARPAAGRKKTPSPSLQDDQEDASAEQDVVLTSLPASPSRLTLTYAGNTEKRDYSIAPSGTAILTDITEEKPSVPGSSFKSPGIVVDTTGLDESLRALLVIQARLQTLSAARMQAQHLVLKDQLKLQKQFMQQQEELIRKMKKLGKRLTIVYI